MLVHTAIFDDHDIAGFPFDTPAVMDIMTSAFKHIKYRTVQMPMLLTIGAWRIGFDMRLNGLRDAGMLRADDVLAVEAWPTLPGFITGLVNTRLVDQLFVKVAVSTPQSTNKSPFLCPSVPFLAIPLGRMVVTGMNMVMRMFMHV